MQTLRLRKVAAVRENKRPQLFGGFVLSAAAFFKENALSRPSRYSEETISITDTVDWRSIAALQFQRTPHLA
jgi:hypothetical protein